MMGVRFGRAPTVFHPVAGVAGADEVAGGAGFWADGGAVLVAPELSDPVACCCC